ncbi:MAG: hypothetical protein GF411_14170 [Candidatus Lokiarchaeota archaeon]|nr:hypothetical protein [Candidatus Lokiarchaeota archaeon]
MRYFIILVLSVSCTMVCAGEGALEDVINQNIQLKRKIRSIAHDKEEADRELEEAKQKHFEKIDKLKQETIEAYQDTMKIYTKKGDIRTASVLLKEIDRLKKEMFTTQLNDALDRSPIQVTGNGFAFTTLTKNGKAYRNRNYVWLHVPEELSGMKYTMIDGGGKPSIVVSGKGTIYVASSIPIPKCTKTNMYISYSDKTKTKLAIYIMDISGKTTIQQNEWQGTLVIMPQ